MEQISAQAAPFAAALLLAYSDDECNLTQENALLLESLGPVEVEDVHASWAAACVAVHEGYDDAVEPNRRVVEEAGLIDAAWAATVWLQAAGATLSVLSKLRRGTGPLH